jgi:sec-independent protein translocase protein TatB
MNFFGLGPIELLIIVVVALLVVGPEKLPELGAMIGRFIIDFRRVSDEVKSAFNDAVVEPRPTWNGSSSTPPPTNAQTYTSASPSDSSEAGQEEEPEARPLGEQSQADEETPPQATDSPDRR